MQNALRRRHERSIRFLYEDAIRHYKDHLKEYGKAECIKCGDAKLLILYYHAQMEKELLETFPPSRTNSTHYSHMPAYTTPQTHIEFANANGAIGSITTNATATAYNTSSDHRLKEHISTTTAGLTALAQISVVDFNFISDPGRRVQGFIAQDLYKDYPEAVNVGGDDPKKNPWAVDYGRLTPLLVKSVQELDQRTKEFKTTGQLNGVILRATDGEACYRLTVNNTGYLNTLPVPCQ